MKRIATNGLHLWEFENLSKEKRIKHFVTDRNSGNSQSAFTLSYSSSPDRELIHANRAAVARAIGIEERLLFLPSQVHKTKTVLVDEQTSKETLAETDALITRSSALGIAVMSADCVPILLYDRKNHAAAAIHAGWRGTVALIVEKALHEMQKHFGTKGENIVAGIGPSVSQEAYEVGEEVVAEVTRAFTNGSRLLIPQANNKAKLDLWNANKLQLLEFGVPESNIEISNLCTVKNNAHFFSARKGDSGRFAAGIMLI